MPRANYGDAVRDHRVCHFSASSLTLADAESETGCLRKYWYEKVGGRRPPSTTAQLVGVALHNEIENYLCTGVDHLGSLALRGKSMIPEPGPDLFVEHDIVIPASIELAAREEPDPQRAADIRGLATIANAPLSIHGVPVIGYIDLLHNRGTNFGASDITDTLDPEGTVEVLDWKTTSNADYIKPADAMARTVQMTLYGKWVLETLPSTKFVRLSHGYFITRGNAAPRKVTVRVPPEQIAKQWTRIERIAGSIIDAAHEYDADNVPANTRACGAFGGCPHRPYCNSGKHEQLVAFFGKDGADKMLRRMANVTTTIPTSATQDNKPRPLLGIVGKKPHDADALRAEILRVGREEIEAKYPGLPATWDELQACNLGHPEFTGELAHVIGELQGSVAVDHIAGEGELGTYGPFEEPTALPSLLQEVRMFILMKDKTPPPTEQVQLSLLPPDAPESDPALAAKSVDHVEPVKKSRGRPRKIKEPETEQQVQVVAKAHETTLTIAPPAAEDSAAAYDTCGVYFYVNCRPSCKHQSFWPIVQEIVDDMNGACEGVTDFRFVSNDHKFAYGRWKAAIAVALAVADIAPGHYVLDGGFGEIAIAVGEAMRMLLATRGGVFVQ